MALHLKKMRDQLLASEGRRQIGADAIEGAFTPRERITMSFSTYRYVLAVLALIGLYLYAVADDRYVTTTKVMIQSSQIASDLSVQGGVAGLVGGGAASVDASLLKEYIHSKDMLRLLQEQTDYRAHFSATDRDPYYRLSADASFEAFLQYYRDHVEINIDIESGILTIAVQAFDSDFAREISDLILRQSAEFINGINQKIAREEIQFVEQELLSAEKNLSDAEQGLLAFQSRSQELSPRASGQAFQSLIDELRGKISTAEVELENLRATRTEENIEVALARDRVAALKQQLKTERAKITNESSKPITQSSAEYSRLELGVRFATERYETILRTLSQKRIESYRKIKNMVVIQTPVNADAATLPDRDYILLTLILIFSLVYGLTVMIIATVQEHRDV